MRVRPLINCIMSEIETFFVFSDLGIDICSISHYLSVLPVFISESVWSLYVFYILSGIDCSESFHISHLYDSGYLFLRIYHSLSRVIHICVTNLGVIWLDPHNFLIRSHGQLLSMTSLVWVLPASTYTSNMVPNI